MKRTLYGTVATIEHTTYQKKNGEPYQVSKCRIEARAPLWCYIDLDLSFEEPPAIGTTFRIDVTELAEKEN